MGLRRDCPSQAPNADRLISDGWTDRCGVGLGYHCSGTAPDGSPDCGATCGDGVGLGEEACDDANVVADDRCADCLTLPEWQCDGEPSAREEVDSVCGNGRAHAGEACGDGDAAAGDSCDVDCAVCEGATYTQWGESLCVRGYDTVHQVWITSFSGGWGNGWGPGGPICPATTSGGSWINWSDTMIMRALGSNGDSRVRYQNAQDMRCRDSY